MPLHDLLLVLTVPILYKVALSIGDGRDIYTYIYIIKKEKLGYSWFLSP